MLPKINFVWSFIYQEEIHLPEGIDYNRSKSKKFVEEFIKQLSVLWENRKKEILNYMEELTGLKWNKDEIDCYVLEISKFGPISCPLTIPIRLKSGENVFTLNVERYFDMLVHELIHCLFTQNQHRLNDYFNLIIKKRYKDYGWNTAIHVPVHALQKEILEYFFGKQRLKSEIIACSYYPEYKKAWDIVLKEGSNLILKKLKSSVGH